MAKVINIEEFKTEYKTDPDFDNKSEKLLISVFEIFGTTETITGLQLVESIAQLGYTLTRIQNFAYANGMVDKKAIIDMLKMIKEESLKNNPKRH